MLFTKVKDTHVCLSLQKWTVKTVAMDNAGAFRLALYNPQETSSVKLWVACSQTLFSLQSPSCARDGKQNRGGFIDR